MTITRRAIASIALGGALTIPAGVASAETTTPTPTPTPAVSNRTPAPQSGRLVIRKVDSLGRTIGADTDASITVEKGATFAGESCVRNPSGVEWACENLGDYGWFRDDLPEIGTTGSHFDAEIPLSNTESDYADAAAESTHKVSVTELTPPTGYTMVGGQATVYRIGGGWVLGNHPANVTLRLSNGYYYLDFHNDKEQTWTPEPSPDPSSTPSVQPESSVTPQPEPSSASSSAPPSADPTPSETPSTAPSETPAPAPTSTAPTPSASASTAAPAPSVTPAASPSVAQQAAPAPSPTQTAGASHGASTTDRPTGLPHTGLANTGSSRNVGIAIGLGVILVAAGIYVWRRQ